MSDASTTPSPCRPIKVTLYVQSENDIIQAANVARVHLEAARSEPKVLTGAEYDVPEFGAFKAWGCWTAVKVRGVEDE